MLARECAWCAHNSRFGWSPAPNKLDVLPHTYNASTPEVETGGSEIQDHFWCYVESSRSAWLLKACNKQASKQTNIQASTSVSQGQLGWHVPVTLAFRRQKQEDPIAWGT